MTLFTCSFQNFGTALSLEIAEIIYFIYIISDDNDNDLTIDTSGYTYKALVWKLRNRWNFKKKFLTIFFFTRSFQNFEKTHYLEITETIYFPYIIERNGRCWWSNLLNLMLNICPFEFVLLPVENFVSLIKLTIEFFKVREILDFWNAYHHSKISTLLY